jgi:putative ATPase
VSDTLFSRQAGVAAPLAARMRPRTLEEYVGQSHLLSPDKPLRKAIDEGRTGSVILWGPPGTGKTTLARLIAQRSQSRFEPFSAAGEGVPRLRQIFDAAREHRQLGGKGTILFVDEIHRLNKGQQDALLPAVEDGTVVLIGATTENPSFEVNGALLSRSRVLVLKPLSEREVAEVLRRALADRERGLGERELSIDDDALSFLARSADGDARRSLVALEAAGHIVAPGGRIALETAREALQLRVQKSDKSGDVHHDQLSAFHKSLRGSDPQGALYWAARLVEGGEDPIVLFRRATAMASEDIGLADPQALQQAVAAREAWRLLGAPEGYLPLAQLVVYLATAPKSNRVKVALDAALQAARESAGAPVPPHIRNAPTRLMKELGHGEGYRYAHDSATGYVAQEYLPDELRGARFYEPGPFGFEKEVARRLEWWARQKDAPRGGAPAEGESTS